MTDCAAELDAKPKKGGKMVPTKKSRIVLKMEQAAKNMAFAEPGDMPENSMEVANQNQDTLRKKNTTEPNKKFSADAIIARIEANRGPLPTREQAELEFEKHAFWKKKKTASILPAVSEKKLDYWPDKSRSMPNPLTRCPLFAVLKPGERRWHKDEIIASRGDSRIIYTGEQLDQADCDVWLQALQFSKIQDVGERIHINRAMFLREMGRPTSGSNYQWLDRALHRLVAATIDIHTTRYQRTLGLLDAYRRDKGTGEYWIRISVEALALFDRNATSYIDWNIRKQIGRGQQLAKWLQNYVCGHARGQHHTIGIKSLHEWCGTTGRLRDFEGRALPKAMKEIKRLGIIEKDKIRKDGMVTWLRP